MITLTFRECGKEEGGQSRSTLIDIIVKAVNDDRDMIAKMLFTNLKRLEREVMT